MKKTFTSIVGPCLLMMLALFLTAAIFRPLLPIDETRYMTVAWEMHLSHGWLSPLTMNFEPYSHKPPMLFWLINIFWSIFGINRWAALIPVTLVSTACVFLTIRLAREILPRESFDPERILWLMLGSVPFFIYSTLVMFDMTMMMFVLCALLSLIAFAQKRQFRYMLFLGIFTGFALLTKGPVAWLYVIFPMLLGPWWVKDFSRPLSWYADCFAGLLISIFPLSVWLFPVLSMSDNNFAFWLLWEQTAGRIAGKFNDAHIRPFYFYLPLLPLVFAPWVFFPSFWHAVRKIDAKAQVTRFVLCWIAPVFVCFSLISGKQPHYLVPLLPGVILLAAMLTQSLSFITIRNTAFAIIALGVMTQDLAAFTLLRPYDLKPIASYVEQNQNKDWAWVRNYHGEVGFLAKIKKPMTDIDDKNKLDAWFDLHPQGLAIVRYENENEVIGWKKIAAFPYRGKYLGIFSHATDNSSPDFSI